MAINLFSLNTPEIIPQKVQNTPNTYKVDPNMLRANWEEKKASATDLIEESKRNGSYRESATLNGTGVSGITARTGAYCNYSSDVFFRKDMPVLANDDGNYTIGGEIFTKEELEECRAVMKTAVDGIGCGIGKNTNIDYKNYAEMEIAAGGVKAYASKNLTEKQANVVNRAMQEYNDALVKLQDDSLSSGDTVDRKCDELSQYYGKGKQVPEEVMDRMRKMFNVSKTGGAVATTQVATNEELIGKIRDLFSNIDYSNSSSIDPVTDKYKELVTPAKLALGVKKSGGYLDSVLNNDIAGFKNQFRNMMNIIGYHAMDFKI